MAESFKMAQGSSEESLPLSQETMNTLWNMLGDSGKAEMLASLNGNLDLSELTAVPAIQPDTPVLGAHVTHTSPGPRTVSSLPATSNWPGDYDFKLLFEQQENYNKHVTWTYSPLVKRLYVRKDSLCPFNFQANTVLPDDVIIRAMALYSSPEHASAVVTRCVNHSQEELLLGVYEAEHLIRCDSRFVQYQIDPETKRHSVVVPYENPSAGQGYSTYIFKFNCFSSCSGGPNRRPLTLVFTLEQGTSVLGRIALDLKICACPRRDRDLAEKDCSSQCAPPPAKKMKGNNGIAIPMDVIENYAKKKLAERKMGKPEYTIKVRDKECYTFLTKMKRLFKTYKLLGVLSLECKDLHQIMRSSSDEDEKS